MPGRPTVGMIVGQGPLVLAVGVGGGFGAFLFPSVFFSLSPSRGGRGGAMVLGKLPVPGRPTYLGNSRARAYCTCCRCRWGLFGHFYSHLSLLFSFSLSLGDGPI